MVFVVATILTVASVGLKPMQDENIANEKRQNILASAGITVEKGQNPADIYNQYITESFLVNQNGEKVEGDAFDKNMNEVAKQVKTFANTGAGDVQLPVFKCNKGGETLYIIPLKGDGLWDKIWGYMSLKEDLNTINGVVFDHAGETAGLGAEITKDYFQQPFVGKKIFEGENKLGIKVYKGGKGAAAAANNTIDGVDAISSATITSNCVGTMVNNTFKAYEKFFMANRK